jgi:hypothetical protein
VKHSEDNLTLKKEKCLQQSAVNNQRNWDRLGVEEYVRKNIKIKIGKIRREGFKLAQVA